MLSRLSRILVFHHTRQLYRSSSFYGLLQWNLLVLSFFFTFVWEAWDRYGRIILSWHRNAMFVFYRRVFRFWLIGRAFFASTIVPRFKDTIYLIIWCSWINISITLHLNVVLYWILRRSLSCSRLCVNIWKVLKLIFLWLFEVKNTSLFAHFRTGGRWHLMF